MATKIKWRTVGNLMTTSIKVMVEGKKRYLRLRVEGDEVISNLELESKVLFNHLWHKTVSYMNFTEWQEKS